MTGTKVPASRSAVAQADSSRTDALAAVDRIIADFSAHRRDSYFAGFDPSATFLFHNVDRRLESRADYEDLWRHWESGGFRVLSCVSTNRRLELIGVDQAHTVAVFTHDVETVAELGGTTATQFERETIVLARTAGTWLAVHEHLSERTPGA